MAFNDKDTQTTTVVGMFEDYRAAERASHQLQEQGIPRESIQVQSNFRTGAAGSVGSGEAHHEGGFMGWWHRLVGEDDSTESGHYAEGVRRGNAVLTVTTTRELAESAADIMNSAGAIDVDDRVAGWREGGYSGYDANVEPYTHEQASTERDRFRSSGEGTTIPVVEEELQVGKRVVRRGAVRVYSQVVERPVNEQITLREEHARVERRPVDRAVTDADMNSLRDQSIEVIETAEEAVIGKRARVREEVVIGKETSERTQQVSDTVRHTEVHVDRTGATDADETYDRDAYNYGSRVAADARYSGRNWDEVESNVREDYTRNYPGGMWDKVKASVRNGWDEVTGKR